MYYGMYQDLARSRQEQRSRGPGGLRRGARQINQQVRIASRRDRVR